MSAKSKPYDYAIYLMDGRKVVVRRVDLDGHFTYQPARNWSDLEPAAAAAIMGHKPIVVNEMILYPCPEALVTLAKFKDREWRRVP